jgi:hypothetical protein
MAAENSDMARIAPAIGTALLVAVLGTACGSSSHPASSVAPTTSASRASSATPTTTTAPRSRDSANAALAGLKQSLESAGSSLDAANSALAQTDPNQTKNEEGTAP